jgi:hypothetical protein
MLAWHVPYLGWTRLPAEVSEFEITHFFSLRAEERNAVLTRYRDPLRLGAALRIGFLKMCGRPLDALQRVPADLLFEVITRRYQQRATMGALKAQTRKDPQAHLLESQSFMSAGFPVGVDSRRLLIDGIATKVAQQIQPVLSGVTRLLIAVINSRCERNQPIAPSMSDQ